MRPFLCTRCTRACGSSWRAAVLVSGLAAVALAQIFLGGMWQRRQPELEGHGTDNTRDGHSHSHSHIPRSLSSATRGSANDAIPHSPGNDVVAPLVTAVGDPSRSERISTGPVGMSSRRELHTTRDATGEYVRVSRWVVPGSTSSARGDDATEWDIALATHTTGKIAFDS
jgi:hypothetical protein